ncbi:hypothetical protein BKK81_02325 [Cupriavidus sp. USMAHM13]|uniref:GTPase domain-containing protein n=1 Tax=Cupriavidus sp. USMAHM13 TaxID=1389192 RepID=UPI0008A67E64|nr:GTPase domain-containing protein [Cupriavidus sp. USMAHM13]AOY98257.1 hypothetical protein BKK81_02325 [Cupriavidus sp. USMAHM13]
MSPFEIYQVLLNDAEPLAARHLEGAPAVIARLRAAVAEKTIHVMLFGAYNAGKSTLINALSGAIVAKVDDVPTTAAVQPYPWNGHVLLDTPGINAPIEHETVTLDEMREQAHLVLFVLRQEDQDAQDIVERLLDIIESGHPLFVLLNYRGEADIAALIERFAATLARAGAARGIPEATLAAVPVLMMNLRSAERGRVDGKPLLLEHARYDMFIDRFAQWLGEYEDEHKRLAGTHALITRELLDPVRAALGNGRAGGADGKAELLAAQLAHLRRDHNVLRLAATSRLRRELQQSRAALGVALDEAGSEAELTAKASTLVGELAETMRKWLELELASQHKARIDAALGDNVLDATQFQSLDEKSWGRLVGPALEQLKNVDSGHIKQLLMWGRQLKIPGLKGRWEKTFDKWAGRAGPAISVVVALGQMGLAEMEERRENERARARAIQRSQCLDQISADIFAGLQASLYEAIDGIFAQQAQPVEADLKTAEAEASALERDRVRWAAIADGFAAARF